MGLTLSLLLPSWESIIKHRFFSLAYNVDFTSHHDKKVTLKTDFFKTQDSETISKTNDSDSKSIRKNSINLNNRHPMKVMLETSLSFKNLFLDIRKSESINSNSQVDVPTQKPISATPLPEPAIFFSPRPVSELNAAAIKLQKVYKSYRTRRNLADCAVVVEELWWKALNFAALKRSSVSFFNVEKPETAVSRWARARTRVAKVGKGLSKDEKAQKLALQHWLEAIDPRHRYGHNLHLYYDVWFESQSSQPFFYWLDIGDGKEINLEKCPRTNLQRQCIKYLGPMEREAYEVIVENGKLLHKQSGTFVETTEDSKWIFVLSTSRILYVGQKKKGQFQHSSFLAGGATTAAGRLVARDGVLEAVWPYSGHYLPTEENFKEFISFLEEHNVDLTNVKRCAIDDDYPYKVFSEEPKPTKALSLPTNTQSDEHIRTSEDDGSIKKWPTVAHHEKEQETDDAKMKEQVFNLAKRLSCKWTTGTGPRIGCVRDYPMDLQFRALEQVNLSPRMSYGPFGNHGPIPSPRPSPKVRLSPRLVYMGLPSPRNPIPAAS